jgi:HEAT repeat protein
MLRKRTDASREEAAEALGALGAREAIFDLLQVLGRDETDVSVRAGAARALGQLGAREAVPELLALAKYRPNEWIRSSAAQALYAIADSIDPSDPAEESPAVAGSPSR